LKRDYWSLYRVRPVLTIGLCVKNNEATIREAVNSIAVQDFSHELMEIIVVDGCSQDQTMRIIGEILSKTDIKIKVFSENQGLGFARQVVVDNALGKYILWVDGDIILSKNYIKQQADFMELHPEVAIAAGSFGLIPDDNWVAMLENICYVIDSLRYHGKTTSKLLGTEASIFRADAIRMAGGFDPDIKGAQEDRDLAYRIGSAGWKFYITNAMLCERQRRTWSALWKQYFWYGYGLHFSQHKNKGRNMMIDKSDDRIIISSQAYRLTYRKVVFLLPLNYIFKKTALLFGFLKAHMDGYGHNYLTPSKESVRLGTTG
jgi:glycosyltransferase involved in cell wall biosynthesis